MRALHAIPFGAALLIAAVSARADTKACEDAFAAAPASVRAGRFLSGKRALLDCSADGCPSAMRSLCLDDERALEPRIPSVVLIAKGADGRELTDVRVSDGDTLVADKLDGRAIELDPGQHRFRFEQPGGEPVVTLALLHEGEKSRPIVATFAATPAVVAPAKGPVATPADSEGRSITPSRPIPWTVYAASGVALLATVGWTYFGIEGISDRSALGSCKGHCAAGPVRSASSQLYIADAFMAVSLVGWAGAATLFLTRPTVVPVVSGGRDRVALGIRATF